MFPSLWVLLAVAWSWRAADGEVFRTANQKTGRKPIILSSAQKEAFARDGYLILKQVFGPGEVDQMVQASRVLVGLATAKQKGLYFSVIQKHILYGLDALRLLGHPIATAATDDPSQICRTKEGGEETCSRDLRTQEIDATMTPEAAVQVFRNAALRSQLPALCAELMGLQQKQGDTLHVLRDVLLAKPVPVPHNNNSQPKDCDWHVDDQGFWPESFLSNRQGMNAWIALDEYSSVWGGGMIVSPGSHTADWRHKAYAAIGQNRSKDGGITRQELVQRGLAAASKSNTTMLHTCAMHENDPKTWQKVQDQWEQIRQDDNKRKMFDLNPGDVLLATRLMFHRTAPFTKEGKQYYIANKKELLHRYSVRYVAGTALLPQGEPMETACYADNFQCAGRPVNQIQPQAWYPRVWPRNIDMEDSQFEALPIQASLEKGDTVVAELRKLLAVGY